eukprot:m.606073 g.606073  ORF g.606073 m.606073 type:complete len:178 (+) comp58111_c0_seq6:1565-2098(+)
MAVRLLFGLVRPLCLASPTFPPAAAWHARTYQTPARDRRQMSESKDVSKDLAPPAAQARALTPTTISRNSLQHIEYRPMSLMEKMKRWSAESDQLLHGSDSRETTWSQSELTASLDAIVKQEQSRRQSADVDNEQAPAAAAPDSATATPTPRPAIARTRSKVSLENLLKAGVYKTVV